MRSAPSKCARNARVRPAISVAAASSSAARRFSSCNRTTSKRSESTSPGSAERGCAALSAWAIACRPCTPSSRSSAVCSWSRCASSAARRALAASWSVVKASSRSRSPSATACRWSTSSSDSRASVGTSWPSVASRSTSGGRRLMLLVPEQLAGQHVGGHVIGPVREALLDVGNLVGAHVGRRVNRLLRVRQLAAARRHFQRVAAGGLGAPGVPAVVVALRALHPGLLRDALGGACRLAVDALDTHDHHLLRTSRPRPHPSGGGSGGAVRVPAGLAAPRPVPAGKDTLSSPLAGSASSQARGSRPALRPSPRYLYCRQVAPGTLVPARSVPCPAYWCCMLFASCSISSTVFSARRL